MREDQIKALKKILDKLINILLKLAKEIYQKQLEQQKDTRKIVEIIIRLNAMKYGVDPELAVRVAKCESNLNPKAKRNVPPYGVDRGLYQWNSFFHPEISDSCAYDPICASEMFCKAVKEGHLNWWYASKHCWSK